MLLRFAGAVELPPDVVDADHHREPVGVEVDHVGLPACREAAGGVAADAGVDDVDAEFGVEGVHHARDDVRVAAAEAVEESSLCDRAFPPDIRDRISDEEQTVSLRKFHDSILLCFC